MPETAQSETVSIRNRNLVLRWKSPRHGEWLAWCYVPGPSMLPHEGAGFEARAPDAEGARAEVLRQVEAYLSEALAGEQARGNETS